MAKITKNTVLEVKRLKRLYPDKTNAEISMTVSPRISDTSVSSILRGRYDHLLSDKMTENVKHLRLYEQKDIIAADKLIMDNPNIPMSEIAKMDGCNVSAEVLCRISVGLYDDIIKQKNENAAKNIADSAQSSARTHMTRSSFQDKEYRQAMDELHNIIFHEPIGADVQEQCKENRVECLKCGSKNVRTVAVLCSKGKTAKLKCNSCGQVMYLSTDDWSKDGKRYERRTW